MYITNYYKIEGINPYNYRKPILIIDEYDTPISRAKSFGEIE